MEELSECDYKHVLKSYTVQDLALEESCKQRSDDYKAYEETFREYKQVKSEFLRCDEEHQIIHRRFTKNLNIKNSFNRLQTIPNHQAKTIQKNVLDLYEMMAKDSNDFVKSVEKYVEKFQNLGTEFDESVVQENKSRYLEKTETLINEIKNKEIEYDSTKNLSKDYEFMDAAHGLKKLLSFSEDSEIMKTKMKIMEIEQHLLLVKKNIDFLIQRNREIAMQCSNFTI